MDNIFNKLYMTSLVRRLSIFQEIMFKRFMGILTHLFMNVWEFILVTCTCDRREIHRLCVSHGHS